MAKVVKFPNLVSEMARNGETQKDLAEVINTDSAGISRRLNGLTKWTIEEVELICEHYNKGYYELFK